ncbi:protein BNIP5-like [Dermochelys coriacea]|uniref:protein BNIP5-like n=1 Tax=Dermochelys coriacea TaxID=27794 RepID=UPI0018E76129|nr:protein BNIP5-like [Dermochelys coriacea]
MEAQWRRPWESESQPKRKFLSLDKKDAKKVLEIYVKRTLSNCEDSFAAKKRVEEANGAQGKKMTKLRRAASDFCGYSGSKLIMRKHQADRAKALRLEDALSEKSKPLACGNATEDEQKPKGKGLKSLSQGKNQPSWIKTLLNFFDWKNTDCKEHSYKKTKEKETSMQRAPSCMEAEMATRTGADSSSSPQLGKTIKKRSSLRRTFSLKKHATEEEKKAGKEAGIKAKRPSFLPLRSVHRPSSQVREEHELYCRQVSEEIQLIIQGNEAKRNRNHSYEELLRPAGTPESEETIIRKIVALLKNTGDHLDKKIKEDTNLTTFFKDISYSSFKHLADVYVNKEVKAQVPEMSTEEIQFAFAVHLTAKVAGICNHAVNRIMGFGNKYLQDTFVQFSYSKNVRDCEKFSTSSCESPD